MCKENINLQELGLALIDKIPEIIGAFGGKTALELLIEKADSVDSPMFVICLFMIIIPIILKNTTDLIAKNKS